MRSSVWRTSRPQCPGQWPGKLDRQQRAVSKQVHARLERGHLRDKRNLRPVLEKDRAGVDVGGCESGQHATADAGDPALALDLRQPGAGAEDAGPGKAGQARDVVAMEVGDDDGANVVRREAEGGQLVGDGVAGLETDRGGPTVEAFGKRLGGGEEGRIIAGVEQHRPLIRMDDQRSEGREDGRGETGVAAGHDGGMRTGPGAQDMDAAAFHDAASPGATVNAVSTASRAGS